MDLEHPKENDKKESRSKHIHPDGVQVTGSPSLHVLTGNKSRLYHQIPDGAKEFSVEMREVVKEMR